MALIFKDAEEAKNSIMASQQKEIQMLYLDWSEDVYDKAYYYAMKSTASSALYERYYKELYKQMKETNKQLGKEIQGIITNNMYMIADAVVADNIKWLESLGFSAEGLNAAFSYIPNDVVQRLITGQIYQGGWNLSQRIWSDNQQTQKDIYQIMARGLAEQKPIYEIAKDLGSYVSPGAKKNWNPVLAMKNTKTGEIEYKRIYKSQVDYNAQRLARTLAQHSYQQSFIAATQKNPFITDYVWHSNGSRTCELCKSRDGMHFKKDELPMDHPNGMCTMEPVVAKDMVDQLADWFNSPDGTYPEIDEFAGNFGYKAEANNVNLNAFKDKFGNSIYNDKFKQAFGDNYLKAKETILSEYNKTKYDITFDFLDDYYAGKIKSSTLDDLFSNSSITVNNSTINTAKKITGNATQDFINKYGTSTKSPNAWYNSLTAAQKAEAKALKDASGLTWNDWYNKNIYVGAPKTAAATAAKTASNIVSAADDVFDAAKWYDSLRKNDLYEFNNLTKSWLKTITASQKSGVVTYTGNAYNDMNCYLRGLRGSTRYGEQIKNCQEALAKASLPRETIVRRGADYNMLNGLGIGQATPQNVGNFIGAVVEDKGFMSTSPVPGGGFTFMDIEYIIKLPQGSQAMYVDSISKHMGEQELLINCGGKFRIEGVEFDKYGDVNKIFMTLINLQ